MDFARRDTSERDLPESHWDRESERKGVGSVDAVRDPVGHIFSAFAICGGAHRGAKRRERGMMCAMKLVLGVMFFLGMCTSEVFAAPRCGTKWQRCCRNRQCRGGKTCFKNRCIPNNWDCNDRRRCGGRHQTCCYGGECNDGYMCHEGNCVPASCPWHDSYVMHGYYYYCDPDNDSDYGPCGEYARCKCDNGHWTNCGNSAPNSDDWCDWRNPDWSSQGCRQGGWKLCDWKSPTNESSDNPTCCSGPGCSEGCPWTWCSWPECEGRKDWSNPNCAWEAPE